MLKLIMLKTYELHNFGILFVDCSYVELPSYPTFCLCHAFLKFSCTKSASMTEYFATHLKMSEIRQARTRKIKSSC